MYQDQHTVESMGTARLLARYAYAYEDYLTQVFGRRFVLAGPVEIRGKIRLLAHFVGEKLSSGERCVPTIDLWVEFNPAMGLFTVWGEYKAKDEQKEPTFTSSPRSGFDNDMLGDPARVFDWLDAVVSVGESKTDDLLSAVAEALDGMMTPAGLLEADLAEMDDGAMVVMLTPEYRMPMDYFVSGSHFPGMTSPDHEDLLMTRTTPDDWAESYLSPVQSAIQGALDRLYGFGTFGVDVDQEGFAYVTPMQPLPKQNFESEQNSRAWYASEILRMAGADGRVKLGDRTLQQEAWYDSGTVIDPSKKKKKAPPATFQLNVKDDENKAKHDSLVKELQKRKKDGENIKDPARLANWILLQKAGRAGRKAKGSEAEEAVENEISLLTIEQRMRALLKR